MSTSRHHRLYINYALESVIASGDRSFDIRKNDKEFQKGDTVEYLTVNYDSNGCNDSYQRMFVISSKELRAIRFEITYVLEGEHIQPGYVIIGIRKIQDNAKEGSK